MRPLAPIQRVRRWQAYLVVWRLHRWFGLSLALPLIVLSATGGLLVVHHELERWLNPERHVVAPPPDPGVRVPLVPIVQALQREAPAGFRPLRVEPGGHPTGSDKVVFVGSDRTTRWSAFVNPYTGEVLWRGHDQSLLTPWLLHLHMHFHAGRWGYVLAGAASVALTLLGITGVWITRDRLRTLFRSPFRRRIGSRLAWSDLHKWVGVATLYFTLVLGATGLWFSILLVPAQIGGERREPLAPAFDLAKLTAIEPAVAATLAHFPGSEPTRVIFPWDKGIKLQVRVLHREAPIWRKHSRIDFDPETGAMLRVRDAREASTAEKWNSILSPLHFGYFGASWVKWAYVVGGFAPALLAVSGTMVWYCRRRQTSARNSPASASAR